MPKPVRVPKERPILFSGPMVRAILDGRKTQTRRALRDQHPIDLGVATHGAHLNRSEVHDHGKLVGHRMVPIHCPYGQPGDRLWVRERHCYLDVAKKPRRDFPGARDEWNLVVEYSDGTEIPRRAYDLLPGKQPPLGRPKQTRERGEVGWRPSIFMPRWASRITLEIVGVRVERLQEISEADALAEGISDDEVQAEFQMAEAMNQREPFPARARYKTLWDSINAKRGFGWDKNPLVWVINFQRAGGKR